MQQNPSEISHHAYALAVSGYTVVPAAVPASELEELRTTAELAFAAENAAEQKQPYTLVTQHYKAVRCMYCWGDAYLRILENTAIHSLAALVMENYQLWDMMLLSALPAPSGVAATTAWHRDFSGVHQGADVPGYLWFFVCLDDVTAQNGGTWVVPGSHRLHSKHEPERDAASGRTLEQYPSRIQLCAKAGDLLVLDPSMLHTSGHNTGPHPRRLLNIALCNNAFSPLMDHWAIAGPAVQKNAGTELRAMLGADRAPLRTTWPVLPEGWQTGT